MAQALMTQRRWLWRMVQTESQSLAETHQGCGRRDEYELPWPGGAEYGNREMAVHDRFQRQFLRLMKCYRDGRRLGVSMTVTGGQVNVAEQQVVVISDDQSELS